MVTNVIFEYMSGKAKLGFLFSGDEQYNCIWFEPRGINIVEYQLGLRPSTIPGPELCDNDHFLQRTWTTQASK